MATTPSPLPAAAAGVPAPGERRGVSPPVPRRRLLALLALVLLLYLTTAYLVVPGLWRSYVHRHPALANIPNITHTANGLPGDPLNVALVGTKAEVMKIMLEAGWYPADPLTLRSCLEIATHTVLKRPYEAAPVSNLYLWGRKEDLAFEKPVGNNPRQRHHVRFWRCDRLEPDGRPLWIGSATYDRKVGFSHTTGQITHHIAPDVDAERDLLFRDLARTGWLAAVETEPSFHTIREGRNGGGDPWWTDGKLFVGELAVPSTSP